MKLLLMIALCWMPTITTLSCKASEQAAKEAGPKDPACSSKSSSECSNDINCQAVGTGCTGSISYCSTLSSSQKSCEAGRGTCKWDAINSNCVPGSSDNVVGGSNCSTGTSTTCNTMPGCTYDGLKCVQSTAGNQTQCTSITIPTQCTNTVGCSWNGVSCTTANGSGGNGALCTTYQQAQCTPANGCSWDGYSCKAMIGNGSQCSTYQQAQCTPANGCSWNGYNCVAGTNGGGGNNQCASYAQPQCLPANGCMWNGSMCVLNSGGNGNANCTGLPVLNCVFTSNCKWSAFMNGQCVSK